MVGLNAGGTDVDCIVNGSEFVRNEAEVDASSSTAARMKKGVSVGLSSSKWWVCPSDGFGSMDADACSF